MKQMLGTPARRFLLYLALFGLNGLVIAPASENVLMNAGFSLIGATVMSVVMELIVLPKVDGLQRKRKDLERR